MNPRIPADIIAEAYESDPQAADAEYGANFRSDIADYISREAIDEVTMHGRRELPPMPGVTTQAFADPSGGISDSFAMPVAHIDAGAICVLDSLTEIKAPFDPEQAVVECTAVLKRYGITRVVSDRFAGLWHAARFKENGILLEQSARPKSDLYIDLLPLVNSRRIELLDNPRLANQLCGLERRTARSGRDSVDHGPGQHDDLANVVAGVLTMLDLDRRPALVRASAMLVAEAALPLPTLVKSIFAFPGAANF